MMASNVGSVARAPGRACSTRRTVSASLGGFGLFGIASSLSSARLAPPAEAVSSAATSAARYDFSEGVFVIAVVVPPLELVDIERHVSAADVMEIADDAALEHRPETLNRVRVNDAAHVFALGMANDRVREFVLEVPIARPFIGYDQVNFFADRVADEALQHFGANGVDDSRRDFAAALDRADDRHLAGTNAAAPATATPAMLVIGLAANEGFIDLNGAEQLALGAVLHRDPDAMAHIPGRFVAAGAEHPVDLMRRHALFRVVHEERDLEPLAQGILGVLEDGFSEDGEPIAVLVAALAEPMEGAGFDLPHFRIAAARAGDAIGPTTRDHEGLAVVFGLEPGEEFVEFHSRDYMATGRMVSSAG